MMNKELFDKGLTIRSKVAGADYVERSLSNATEFNMPMQELATEYCWGWLWGRDGLDHRTRSCINVALLAALNRPQELKTHVRGALRNGVKKSEITEILLQVAVYCGIPAGIDGFRNATEVVEGFDEAVSE